jgi:myo-inositol-1-phosphate synthase
MKESVRVAIAGVGNCASSLIQGTCYYHDAPADAKIPGLMHVDLGGYHVGDVQFVAAFDVDADKVGKDLSQAIFSGQNNTYRFANVPPLGVTVQRGPTLDGLGKYLREKITESDARPVDVAAALRAAHADVLINYLPVGSEDGARFYAEQALAAGCGFVNCIPVFIAKDPAWRRRFEEARLRRDDHAPRADTPVRGPRGAHRPHLPAQFRRQHRLHEHARAGAP